MYVNTHDGRYWTQQDTPHGASLPTKPIRDLQPNQSEWGGVGWGGCPVTFIAFITVRPNPVKIRRDVFV